MNSFLNACGLQGPLRLIIEGPGAGSGQTREFPQPFAVIGRDLRTDVVLDDPQVSRRHVFLQAIGGWLFWLDLESRLGSRTEAGAHKSGWLAGRGYLGIGPYLVRRGPIEVRGPGAMVGAGLAGGRIPRESPLIAESFGPDPLPEASLEFLNGPSQSMRWPMRRVLSLVGSAKGCKFRLTDPSVSAFHASLLRTPTGVWAVDLRGGRSITINDAAVRYGPLADGDVLGVGRYRIVLRCPAAGRSSGAGPMAAPAGIGEGPSWWPPSSPAALSDQAAARPVAGPPASFPAPALAGALAALSTNSIVCGTSSISSTPSATGPLEPALVPLVNQFSLMQQQMFDQFQQAMGMLVQMFGSMHREQMNVIREELDRLHELSRELQELKEALAGGPSSRAGQSSAPSVAGAAAPAAFAGPVASQPGPKPPDPATTPAPAAPLPFSSAPGPAAVGNVEAGDAPPPGQPGHDAVAWIHHRILTIQDEREARWRKILKLFPGAT